MKNKFFIKILTLVMMICISISVFGVSFVKADTNSNSFVINTAEELIEFADNCSLDTYSEGKTIILNEDISLSGKKFTGIPIFSGTFEGNNHTISGLSFDGVNVDLGFFGIITESGSVKNLNLEGNLKTSGVVNAVGTIASANYGTINNCSFSGKIDNGTYLRDIEADQCTGGIVGNNGDTGNIVNCKVYGSVKGLKYTGGIAGENFGQIYNCQNNASVNNNIKDKKLALKDMDFSSIQGILDVLNRNKVYAAENTGGVVGYNEGYISSCYNTGTIGTKQNGYNVGGIVGRTNGVVTKCTNSGNVYGNENVGGIAGQMEPSVSLSYSDDLLGGVKTSIDDIFANIDSTVEDMKVDVDSISNNISGVTNSIKKATVSAAELEVMLADYVNSLENTVSGEFTAINNLLKCAQNVSGDLKQTSDDAQKLVDNVTDGLDAVKNISEQISDTVAGYAVEKNSTPIAQAEDVKGEILWSCSVPTMMPSYVMVYLLGNGKIIEGKRISPKSVKQDDGTYVDKWLYSFTNLPKYEADGTTIIDYEVRENELRLSFDTLDLVSDETHGSGWIVTYDEDTITNTKTNDGLNTAHFTGTSGMLDVNVIWSEDIYVGDAYRPQKGNTTYYVYAVLDDGSVKVLGSDTFTNADSTTNPNVWHLYRNDLPTQYKIVVDGNEKIHNITKYYFTVNEIKDYYPTYVYSVNGFITDVTEVLSDSAGYSTINYILDASASVATNVTATIESFKEASNEASVVMGDISTVLANINTMIVPQLVTIPNVPSYINDKVNELVNNLNNTVTYVDYVNKSTANLTNNVLSDVQDISSDASGTFDSLFQTISDITNSFGAMLVDESFAVSDEDSLIIRDTSDDLGVISKCENVGNVTGETAVGGIAGASNLTRIPIIDASEEANGISIPQIRYKALVDSCINQANIVATDDYAGLICGNQTFGAITDSKAYGNVQSIRGNYVGGIAGYSHGVIASSSSQGNISGKYYVGGIVGSGDSDSAILSDSSVSDCYAMVEIINETQYSGAISGNDKGYFENNYFYSNSLKGINGHSISGQYEPLDRNTYINKAAVRDLSSLPFKSQMNPNCIKMLFVFSIIAVAIIAFIFFIIKSKKNANIIKK